MKIIAVTACPTGIAHTYMAAEALEIAAEELGYDIKIETQGAYGVENTLTQKDIERADVIIIASDKEVDKSRFSKKIIIETSTQAVIRDSKKVIEEATSGVYKNNTRNIFMELYRHILAGVSVIVPFLVIGAVFRSIFEFIDNPFIKNNNDIQTLFILVASIAFKLALPAMTVYIAISVDNMSALVPGMIVGFLVQYLNGGFFAAIVTALLCGYITKLMKKYIKIDKDIEGLKMVFLVPIMATFITVIISSIILRKPFEFIDNYVQYVLLGKIGVVTILLGIALGGMMAYDLGGKVNKLAYLVGLASIFSGSKSGIMAAVMAAGMVPPLSVGLFTLVFRKRFSPKEQKLGISALKKGFVFITEGAIHFANSDPKRVKPALISGSALTGALIVAFNCRTNSPVGGVASLVIPGLVTKPVYFVTAICAGTITAFIIMIVLKGFLKFNTNKGESYEKK